LLRVFFLALIIGILGSLWQWYQHVTVEVKAEGGSVHEGIIGAPRFINPVLAQSQADQDLTRLVFTPLVSIDRTGSVRYLLAESLETSPDGLSYTLTLKDDLSFEDGEALTANDVVFTVKAIQDSLIKSPLNARWQGVEVNKVDQRTVIFNLARPFNDFPYNLEIGILPEHIWGEVEPEAFVFNTYNTNPVGSGPYHVSSIDVADTGVPKKYTLTRSSSSVEAPYLKHVTLNFFENEAALTEALEDGSIDAAYGLAPGSILDIDQDRIHSATLPRVFALFFNLGAEKSVLGSSKIRQAISLAINKDILVKDTFGDFAYPINSAFGFTDEASWFDPGKAINMIESDGWKRNEDGWYSKSDKDGETILAFSIAVPNLEEVRAVAQHIEEDLAAVGIKVTVRSYDQGNFNQNILRPRDYEAIIFGYEIEKPTDIYAFWHSSQVSDPGLNISLFKDANVDSLLSGLRTSRDPDLDTIDDAITSRYPAVFLYAPSYVYVLPKRVRGTSFSIARSSDRFDRISEWYVATRHVWSWFVDEDEA